MIAAWLIPWMMKASEAAPRGIYMFCVCESSATLWVDYPDSISSDVSGTRILHAQSSETSA